MANNKIRIPTYENKYKNNVQMQYANDYKLFDMDMSKTTLSFWASMYRLARNYMQELVDFDDAKSLQPDSADENALSRVGSLYGLEPLSSYKIAYPNITADDYKLLIKAKQAEGQFDGTTASMLAIANSLFPDIQICVIDNGDMSITIIATGEISATAATLLSNQMLLPKVAGVDYTITFQTQQPTHWNFQEGDDTTTQGIIDPDDGITGSWGQTQWRHGDSENND